MPANPLPSELAHLAQPVAPPPSAQPDGAPAGRARLSILSLLGFLAGGVAFTAGVVSAAWMKWASAGDWSVLDAAIHNRGGRNLLAGLIFADPGAIHGVAIFAAVGALVAGVLLFTFNLATAFSVGRKTGVRGAGYAVFGALLTLVGGLGVAKAADAIGRPANAWRHIAGTLQPAQVKLAYADAAKQLPGRLDRLGAVNALAHRGATGVEGLVEIAAKDPSPAVRYAATRALARPGGGEAATSAAAPPSFSPGAKAALEARLQDDDPTIRDLARWALSDPATREPWERPRHRRCGPAGCGGKAGAVPEAAPAAPKAPEPPSGQPGSGMAF